MVGASGFCLGTVARMAGKTCPRSSIPLRLAGSRRARTAGRGPWATSNISGSTQPTSFWRVHRSVRAWRQHIFCCHTWMTPCGTRPAIVLVTVSRVSSSIWWRAISPKKGGEEGPANGRSGAEARSGFGSDIGRSNRYDACVSFSVNARPGGGNDERLGGPRLNADPLEAAGPPSRQSYAQPRAHARFTSLTISA